MNAAQQSLKILNDLIAEKQGRGRVNENLIAVSASLRDKILEIETENKPQMKTYLNRSEHIAGGLSVTCVCNFTTHFDPSELGSFALDMACPNCGRNFWAGHKPIAYRGIRDKTGQD